MKWLMQIFKVILTDKAGATVLGKKMLKWYNKYKVLREKIGKVKHVYNLVMNPTNWLHALETLPKTELNNFFKTLSDWKTYYDSPEFKNNERWMYKDEGYDVSMPSTTETQVFQTNNEQVKKKLEEMDKEINGVGVPAWVELSSSWILRGSYHMVMKNKLLGTLTIEVKKTGKSYTYPAVPYDVWVLMKEANGYNGGGAGTVFWKYFLHDWIHSAIRAKAKADFENNKIGQDELNIAIDQARRTQTTFFRSNTAKNTKDKFNYDWYKSLGGKGYRQKHYATYKAMFIEKSKYMTYTPKVNGFTTHIKDIRRHRNPNYINKREQGRIRREAREQAHQQAQPFVNLRHTQRNIRKAETYTRYPFSSAKQGLKRSIIRSYKRRKKNK